MNKIFCIVVIVVVALMSSLSHAVMNSMENHESMIYPIVRVTYSRGGGSGTVIYSKGSSTFILTNHHVVSDAITVNKEWDTDLQKEVQKEKRDIVYVEIFKYRKVSIPIGTLKIEAEIVLYNKDEDMALLKLRSEEPVKHVATLYPRDQIDNLHVMVRTVSVGCSLLYPPLPATGILTRINQHIDSLPYHMSSSQIIFGNSGGGMFTQYTGEFIGIPARVAVIGWGTPVTHMGYFIPIDRVYDWLEREHYDFIFDSEKVESDCMTERDEEIKARKKQKD